MAFLDKKIRDSTQKLSKIPYFMAFLALLGGAMADFQPFLALLSRAMAYFQAFLVLLSTAIVYILVLLSGAMA